MEDVVSMEGMWKDVGSMIERVAQIELAELSEEELEKVAKFLRLADSLLTSLCAFEIRKRRQMKRLKAERNMKWGKDVRVTFANVNAMVSGKDRRRAKKRTGKKSHTTKKGSKS